MAFIVITNHGSMSDIEAAFIITNRGIDYNKLGQTLLLKIGAKLLQIGAIITYPYTSISFKL